MCPRNFHIKTTTADKIFLKKEEKQEEKIKVYSILIFGSPPDFKIICIYVQKYKNTKEVQYRDDLKWTCCTPHGCF